MSGVQIIITAVFLFLSFCLTGDWFCQFHRLHVPWNMPRPFYLLSISADPLLEQKTVQQGVYWNSWWVHICSSIPLSRPQSISIARKSPIQYWLSVIVSRNLCLARSSSDITEAPSQHHWPLFETLLSQLKSFPLFSSGVFHSVDLWTKSVIRGKFSLYLWYTVSWKLCPCVTSAEPTNQRRTTNQSNQGVCPCCSS